MTACIVLGDTKGVVTVKPAIGPVPGGLMQGAGLLVWPATPARSKVALRMPCAKLRAPSPVCRQRLPINLLRQPARIKDCDCL